MEKNEVSRQPIKAKNIKLITALRDNLLRRKANKAQDKTNKPQAKKSENLVEGRMQVFLFIAAVIGIPGCANEVVTHGYNFNESLVEELAPGVSTKQDGGRIMGTPTICSDFGPESCFYISAKYKKQAFLKPKLIEQAILEVRFDSDVMKEIKRYSMDDAHVIDFEERFTFIKGNEMGVTEQFISNIGKFNTKTPVR